MKAFKQQCIELRTQGRTLSDIVRITGRGKTTVFHHIQHMPLSAEKMSALKRANSKHLQEFSRQRKGKSKRPFVPFGAWDKETVLLISHLLFDGSIAGSGCMYNNRSETLISRVERCMRSVYSFPPARYKNPHTDVFRISYFNVALGAYIKRKASELLDGISQFPDDLKVEFLRAFFDDEGCIYFRDNKKRLVRGYQKNITILKIVQGLLTDIGIRSRIELPNEVVISGKENLIKFQQELNFSEGVFINGNRSNSVWKKSLEKRELLRMAIESFQS